MTTADDTKARMEVIQGQLVDAIGRGEVEGFAISEDDEVEGFSGPVCVLGGMAIGGAAVGGGMMLGGGAVIAGVAIYNAGYDAGAEDAKKRKPPAKKG